MFPSAPVNGVLHADAVQYLFDHGSPCYRNDFSSSFFQYFSPPIDEGDGEPLLPHQQDFLNDHFPQHQLQMTNATNPPTAEAISNITPEPKLLPGDICFMGPPQNFFPRKKMSSLGRKRGSKKDRHSKIFTRQGPRDRRMRLSLEIAREFFDLQDMLGFDKASKTVDWLMTNSREAIKKLTRGLSRANGGGSGTAKSTVSSASEGEVVSGFVESPGNPNCRKEKAKEATQKAKSCRPSRKAAFNPPSKEGRAIARARARERTKTKKMMNLKVDESDQIPNPINSYEYDPNQLATYSSPQETGDQEPGSQTGDKKYPSELLAEVEQLPSLSLDHQSSLHDVTAADDSLSILQYHPQISISIGLTSDDLISLQCNEINSILQQNWELDSMRPNSGYVIPNAHLSADNLQDRVSSPLFKMPTGNRFHPQFSDAQIYTKPWENYNC